MCRRVASRASLVTLYLNESKDAGCSTSSSNTPNQDQHAKSSRREDSRRGSSKFDPSEEEEEEDTPFDEMIQSVKQRWQRGVMDRARLASRIVELETENERLKSQLSEVVHELNRCRSDRSCMRTTMALKSPSRLTIAADTRSGAEANSIAGSNSNNDADAAEKRSRVEIIRSDSSKLNDSIDKGTLRSELLEDGAYPSGVGNEADAQPHDFDFPYTYDTLCPSDLAQSMLGEWVLGESFDMHSEQIHGCAVHPTLPLVATASWDVTCNIYDIKEHRLVSKLEGAHSKGLYAVEFSEADHNVVGTVSSDCTCQIWDVESGRHLVSCKGHTDEVNGMCFHPFLKSIVATASDDRTIIVWDIERRMPKEVLTGHRNSVYGLSFNGKSKGAGSTAVLASAAFDWTTLIWDLRIGAPVQTLEGHMDDIIGVDFSPSGIALATGSDDGTARIWDARMWRSIAILGDHEGEVKRVKFGPYGRSLVTTSGDGTAKVWDMQTYESTATLAGHTDHVFDAAWDPAGHFIVTASHDTKWCLWRPEDVSIS